MQEEYVPNTELSTAKLLMGDPETVEQYKEFKKFCYEEGYLDKGALKQLKSLCGNKSLRRVTKYTMGCGNYNNKIKWEESGWNYKKVEVK